MPAGRGTLATLQWFRQEVERLEKENARLRAGLEASPSEERVKALVEAAERLVSDVMRNDPRIIMVPDADALRTTLAALRTTKEGG